MSRDLRTRGNAEGRNLHSQTDSMWIRLGISWTPFAVLSVNMAHYSIVM